MDFQFTNFGYIVERKRELSPEQIAFIDHRQDKSYSYRDLDNYSNRVAHSLTELGIKKGDRVLALLENSFEFFSLLFACNKLAAILVPTNFRLSPAEVKLIAEDVQPTIAVYDSNYSSKIQEYQAKNSTAVKFVQVTSSHPSNSDLDFYKLIDGKRETSPGIHGGGDDPNVILYTSGSTGKVKGVIQSHFNTFVKSVDLIVDLHLSEKDRLLTMAPIFHVGGLNVLTLSILHVGGSVILLNKFEPSEALSIIQERRVTHFFAIPTMLKMMVNLPAWNDADLRSLRFVVSGGEPVPQRVKDEFSSKKIPVLPAYGLTEGSSMSLYFRDVAAKDASCVGQPPTHLECRIVDELGRDVPLGTVGELLQRGPTVTPGYWGKAEETSRMIVSGWLHTGDLVFKDANDYYYFIGRRDDMIKSGGEKVYPAEVEEAIYTHPKVAEVAVISKAHEIWGEVAIAIVAPKTGIGLSPEEITEFCKVRISSYKVPKQVLIVDQLPHTGSGKVDRRAVKQIYG